MICEKCGKTINDNAVFCPFCGEKSSASVTSNNKKGYGFWKFIWCDYLYILLYIDLFFVIISSVFTRGYGISYKTIIFLVLFLSTIIMWKTDKPKPALVLLIATTGFTILINALRIPGIVLSIILCFFLFGIIKGLKGQWTDPYSPKDFYIEFTGIKKWQMLFFLISLSTLIVAVASPTYSKAFSLGSNNLYFDGKKLIESLGADGGGLFKVFILFISIVLCIIFLRMSRIAHYLPLCVYLALEIYIIYSVYKNIKTYFDIGIFSCGKYGGLGCYALIASAISAFLSIVVLLFKSKKPEVKEEI